MEQNACRSVLLTGATGYVGGRLLSLLEQRGIRVRCLSRRPEALRGRLGATTEAFAGDVLDPGSLAAALQGVDTAYYVVHSMGADRDFEETDRTAATNFARAACAADVGRIIYLGGLGNPDETLSPHLRSRQETGVILREHHPQVIEFRASIVIGSGSLSVAIGCGRCAVSWTCCAAAAVSVEAAGTRKVCAWAMGWTSGESNCMSRRIDCGCAPR